MLLARINVTLFNGFAHEARHMRPGKEHAPTVPTHVAMFLATQDTPKADAHAVQDAFKTLVLITGDPQHDVFALRRKAKSAANDYTDFTIDHTDLMQRLSSPRPPEELPAETRPRTKLGPGARACLQRAILGPAAETKEAARADAQDSRQE